MPALRSSLPATRCALAFGAALYLLCAVPAAAQLTDTFSDGDFTSRPPWTGKTEGWTIAPLEGSSALRTNGAAADTVYLVTPSALGHGRWTFTFAYRDVNLSTFNGARVYLVADAADLTGPVHGYFLQLGTNNTDEVRLYRQDGEAAGQRVLLAAGPTPLLDGTSGLLRLSVTRSAAGGWTVSANGEPVLSADDDTYASGAYFGLWVKHSQSAGTAFFFDEVAAEAEEGGSDMTPPAPLEATYRPAPPSLLVRFSEPLDPATVAPGAFTVEGLGSPAAAAPDPLRPHEVTLLLDRPLAAGAHTLSMSGLRDPSGNAVLPGTTIPFTVRAQADPPVLREVAAREEQRVAVVFSRAVSACSPDPYEILPGIGRPSGVEGCVPQGQDRHVLLLPRPLTHGETYTLEVRGLADAAGNPFADTSAAFVFFASDAAAPRPRDVVLNEIAYAPPDAEGEFVELFNRSAQPFDLSRFTLSDARRVETALAARPYALPPGGYVVLVRSDSAFRAAFPGTASLEVSPWPALNNSGDAVVLSYEGTVVDSLTFASSWGAPGVSLERRDPSGPTAEPLNWGASEDPRGGTPGAENSLYAIDEAPPVLLSATPSADGQALLLAFSEPLAPSSFAPDHFALVPGPGVGSAAPGASAGLVLLTLAAPLQAGSHHVLVRAVSDVWGNVLEEASLDFLFFPAEAPAPRDLVVNEIYYDPPEPEHEFVELFNRSGATFELGRFTLSDNRGGRVPLSPVPVALPPGGYAVLARDAAALGEAFPGAVLLQPAPWPSLNNTGDAVVLRYGDLPVDSVAFTPGWGSPGVSLERVDPEGPSSSRFNFGPSRAPGGATPGASNSILAPDERAPALRFAGETEGGLVDLLFDEPVDTLALADDAFRLEDGTRLRLRGVLSEGTQLRLEAPGGLSGNTLTVRGVRDLTGNTMEEGQIVLGYLPGPGEVVINEILYDPLADRHDDRPDQPEYVELFNRSARPLGLRHLYWTGRADEQGRADTLRLGDVLRSLAPGGFAVVFADPGADPVSSGPSTLAAAFPGTNFAQEGVVLMPVARTTLALANEGSRIRLQRSGAVLDDVSYDPAYHHPALLDATGVSLERLSPTAPSEAPASWMSSVAAEGGTPGRANSVSVPPETAGPPGLRIEPSPFSPDRDGVDDLAAIRYTLTRDAALLRVRIFDAYGRLVRSLQEAALAGRSGQLVWDGYDDDGHPLRIGIYVVLLEAVDASSGTAEAYREAVVLARRLD